MSLEAVYAATNSTATNGSVLIWSGATANSLYAAGTLPINVRDASSSTHLCKINAEGVEYVVSINGRAYTSGSTSQIFYLPVEQFDFFTIEAVVVIVDSEAAVFCIMMKLFLECSWLTRKILVLQLDMNLLHSWRRLPRAVILAHWANTAQTPRVTLQSVFLAHRAHILMELLTGRTVMIVRKAPHLRAERGARSVPLARLGSPASMGLVLIAPLELIRMWLV